MTFQTFTNLDNFCHAVLLLSVGCLPEFCRAVIQHPSYDELWKTTDTIEQCIEFCNMYSIPYSR